MFNGLLRQKRSQCCASFRRVKFQANQATEISIYLGSTVDQKKTAAANDIGAGDYNNPQTRVHVKSEMSLVYIYQPSSPNYSRSSIVSRAWPNQVGQKATAPVKTSPGFLEITRWQGTVGCCGVQL